jgi:Big-like domain-containing protein
LRKLAAALAVPIIAPIRVVSAAYRSIGSPILVTITALTVAAFGVLALSAPTGTNAIPPGTILPVTDAAIRTDLRVGQALDATITISFAMPMNRVSVAGLVRVVPATSVDLSWDESATVLSVRPTATWQAGALHTITVDAGALGASGAPMSGPLEAAFLTRDSTSATIAPMKLVGGKVAPDTGFEVVFDGAVDAATIADGVRFDPPVSGTVARLGRRGVVRYVFTPTSPLTPNATYQVSLASSVRDVEGASLDPATLSVKTADAPTVVRFRPRDGTRAVARAVDLSVRFSEPMDRASTKSAVTVTADGAAVKGTIQFADRDTVLVFHPAKPFHFGQQVVMTVAPSASAATGASLVAAVAGTFTTRGSAKASADPATTTPIPPGGSVGGGTWAAVEGYYLKLMNCTRTGGWVTSGGACSSPGGRNVAPLWIDQGISSDVTRPYARLLATRGACNHFIGGNPGDRLRRAGYPSYIWAENLGCRSGNPSKAVLGSHLFFQAEKPYRGGHYVNLMNAKYDRVGLGVWVAGGRVRLVIDFYHPR